MRVKLYSIVITLLIAFSSCSKDEEFITISPSVINFVHENGSLISEGECIDPAGNYAISIKTKSNGKGSFKATKIEYTLNGILHSMTFMRDGTQINKVKLDEGLNTAQIVESGHIVTIYGVVQGDFELVQ